ncbi:MAG TPA: hypothetical protein VJA94_23130 [Candidatus Angelobacter sp.]
MMRVVLLVIGFLFMVALLLMLPMLGDLDSGWAGWVLGLAGWGVYYAIIDFIYKHPKKKKNSD